MNPNPAAYAAMQQHHQQQQQHQQHQNHMLVAAAAGYPMQTGSPANQQFPFYANNNNNNNNNNNPMAAAGYPQMRPGAVQQQMHPFNGMPTQTSGGMMPANMSAPHANLPYSSPSPYPPTSIATSTPSPSHAQSPLTLPTTSVQQSAQNMAAFSNPAMMAAAQQRPSPTVQTEGQQQQQQQSAPQSPATAGRERDRIGALLNINSALFREVVNLQASGKAGPPPQPAPGQDGSPAPKPMPTDPSKKPSQEYVDCMRRLQANLAYLATIADRNKKPGNTVPQAPQILTPPPNVPGMDELYARLNELFPEASRNPTTPAQQKPAESVSRPAASPGAPRRSGPPPNQRPRRCNPTDFASNAAARLTSSASSTRPPSCFVFDAARNKIERGEKRKNRPRSLQSAPLPSFSFLWMPAALLRARTVAAIASGPAALLPLASWNLASSTSDLHIANSHKRPLCVASSRASRELKSASLAPVRRRPRYSSSSDKFPLLQFSRPQSVQQQASRLLLYLHSHRRGYSTVAYTMTGEARPKRKHSPIAAAERPAKHLKPESTVLPPGDETPSNGAVYNNDVDEELDIAPVLALGTGPADSPEWQATIESVVKSVVSIHFCQTCSFDTDLSMCSQATGFVVDAEKGYILTNRHVVCAGPFWGYCIFDNHEECDVRPVYRDPVHDFGILKFDPKAIKYMDMTELKLNPEGAQVGVEIRVVGNDAGEKLSILSGVISRLDRNAPEYGEGYSDFNTNYIQAAAAASGGSSGSPVVNINGQVVALQAGGRADGAATDYFLPLNRPLRALQCIREGKFVARGTIQTQWIIKPFDECRRLGLTPEWEATVRKQAPKETGMLVAEIVLPEGPGDGQLEEGDVLLKVNGELLTQFVRLDDILDSSVGQSVKLLVQRGGQDLEVECQVGDLHAITPDRFVTVAGGTFHNLSYQQARLYAIPTRGLYVCEASGSFKVDNTHSGWIIDAVDYKPTPDLDAFIEVMKTIPDRERIVISYRHIQNLHTHNTSVIHIDRHWHPKMSLAVRNDETGLWDFKDIGEPVPAKPQEPKKADFIQLDGVSQPAAAEIVRSFVRVSCSMPLKMDGFPQGKKTGFGVVVDAEKGLVVVSRAIVPYDLCDINITVADSIIVTGKVLFMHPLQNYAIVQYDPSLVQAPVKSARLSTENIKQGQDTIFVGFNQNFRIVVAKTTITDITTVSIPANVAAPRYRAINLDAITVDTGLSSQCASGVLVGDDGVVQALWLNYLGERTGSSHKDVEYHLGLATPSLLPIISKIQQGEIPKLRIMSMESYVIQMSQARVMGVSEEWIERVAAANPSRHQLFMVRKVDTPPPSFTEQDADNTLKEGDVILTLNDKLITRVSEFDVMYDNKTLDALIVRDGQEMRIKVSTIPTEDLETDRAVFFCGAVLQKPHHAVRQQISKLHSEIYISARSRGSPAYQYGLSPTNFITAVNGVQTHDLDAFVREVTKIPNNTYFRLRAVTFDNVPWVVTMKKNDHYFSMSEYVKDSTTESGWKVVTYPTADEAAADSSNLTADAMDEGGAEGGSDVEPDDS